MRKLKETLSQKTWHIPPGIQFDTGIGDDYDYDSVNRRKLGKSSFNSDECNYSLYGTKYLGLDTASGTVLGSQNH